MGDNQGAPDTDLAEDRYGQTSASQKKIEAIYELRDAVEDRVNAEHAAKQQGTPESRDVLLDATLKVEAKTQDAIEACHECGRVHASEEPHERHARVGQQHDGNVIDVDFRPSQASD